MVEMNSKQIRDKTDDFVLENDEITRQIFYDLVSLLVQKKIGLTPSERTDVLVDIIYVLYQAEVLQRVSDRMQE